MGDPPMFVTERGSGPAVVLLHGQPGEGREWEPVVTLLEGQARVIVPDRPGYGRTGGRAMGPRANADAVVAMLDRLEVESAVFVGHSWAGAILLDLALRYPGRTRGLVLVAAVGGRGSIDPLDRVLVLPVVGPVLSLIGVAALQAPRLRRLALRRIRRAVASSGTAEAPPDPLEGSFEAVAASPGPWPGWLGAWRSFVVEQRALMEELPSIAARLGEITAPAVVIIGEADRVVRPVSQEDLAAALPRGEVVRVPGVGHVLPAATPEVIVAAVASMAAASPEGS